MTFGGVMPSPRSKTGSSFSSVWSLAEVWSGVEWSLPESWSCAWARKISGTTSAVTITNVPRADLSNARLFRPARRAARVAVCALFFAFIYLNRLRAEVALFRLREFKHQFRELQRITDSGPV